MKKQGAMIVIRADANPDIGMGHIMRCLSLADAFCNYGHKVIFVLAENAANELVASRGYNSIVLNSDYKHMDEELSKWPDLHPDILIIDSYFVTFEYLKFVHKKTKRLVYIDDLAAFSYPVDILVNYNAFGPYIDYKTLYKNGNVAEPCFILGPNYAPLRVMFRGVEKKVQPKIIKNVLLSTGGSDELHIALNTVRYILTENKGKDGAITYHFLIGLMNKDKEEICKLTEGKKGIVLHENVKDMKSLICSCDLVVSAAGSTLYEICACGVPLITYVIADNQIPGADAFEKLGVAVNLGDLRVLGSHGDGLASTGALRSDAADLIMSSIEELSNDFEKRIVVGNRMQEMIDGFGADRIVKDII